MLQSKISREKKANETKDAEQAERATKNQLRIGRLRRTRRRFESVAGIRGCIKPFMMEGLMCGNKFKTSIHTGTLVSLFAGDELRKVIGKHWVVVRKIIDDKIYVDFNRCLITGIHVRERTCGNDKNVQSESAGCEEGIDVPCQS